MLSKALALATLLAMNPLLAESKKLKIEIDANDTWHDSTRSLIEKAAQIVFDRVNDNAVAQCAYRNSFRENVDKIRSKWGTEITVLNKNPEVTLKILKRKMDRSILGMAQLNRARVDQDYFRIHHLEIILNEDNLNQFADKFPLANGDKELSSWINTIAHELAHNFGYQHGQSGNWVKDYPGYFPTELGFCVMSDGKEGSDLGDYELRRKFKESK